MAGYWLGPVTPEEVKPHFFYEEKMFGYEAFIKRIAELDEINFDNDQILVLFSGESDKQLNLAPENGEEVIFHTTQYWDPDCQLLGNVLDYLKVRCDPVGWLLHVGIGTMDEWRNPNNPFKKDPRLRLTKLPTLMAWNTMKKISGLQALQIQNILVMLED